MPENPKADAVTSFYETHPINEQQIVDKMKADGVDLATLSENELQNYDQDHYGGLAANDALCRLAAIDAECAVLDVGSGMGGPARYLAHNLGCRVTGIDLTPGRVQGATKLTAMAGLDDRVTYRCADALALPFADRSFDAAISQEAFCHIPNKDRLVDECVRVLKPGGRIAFTDILVTERTTKASKERVEREMTFQELGSFDSYRKRLEQAGCEVAFEDISAEWRVILVDRLAMYRSLKDQTVERFGQARFDEWDSAYSFFVGLYETGELGGGRFLGRRKAA